MSLRIESNGSKWGGQDPDPLPVLLDVLSREPLNPHFEKYGNFIYKTKGKDEYQAWGNFLYVSHVFQSFGTKAEILELKRAIRKNQKTEAYRTAKRELEARLMAGERN